MITWNRLARDLAQMLTTCPLYPSLLCGIYKRNLIKMGKKIVTKVFAQLVKYKVLLSETALKQ